MDVKAAYVEGLDRLAVKLGAGFFGKSELGLRHGERLIARNKRIIQENLKLPDDFFTAREEPY